MRARTERWGSSRTSASPISSISARPARPPTNASAPISLPASAGFDMELNAYFDRIGFEGAPRPDLDTLTRIHRGHLNAIPYENLDVLFRARLDFDIERIFDKL